MQCNSKIPNRVPGVPVRGAVCSFSQLLGVGLLLVTLSGCNSINGLVDGFERDVDGFAARMDTWSDQLLPNGGVGPQKYEPTHVDLKPPPKPSQYAGHTRFGKPHQ